VRCKFAGNPDFDEPTANADVLLFWRAKAPLPAFCANLDALDWQLTKEKAAPKEKGGRPGDFHLPDLFCDLEELYTKAEGRVTGVTKKCVNGESIRVCSFVDFVNAILRFAPDGCGPSSREAVAVAWERQWQRRRAIHAEPTAGRSGLG
jgi:hypothetical protein